MNTFFSWRDKIGPLRYLAAQVARVHGPTHPDMAILAEAIDTLAHSADSDHAGQAALAQRIRVLTDDFRPWAGACSTVQRLFTGLADAIAAIPPTAGDHS